ncbi:WcbI family polysaccharide biosynthesis putative acetyltransferase [Acidisphaera sp. L21]|uniref:WcbI family polysaccharide biosynthesis putative acetyltransferase n=1 Tax=Acidisphaera sp. L21 TaxID=1641851 RepID=UPI00131D05A4
MVFTLPSSGGVCGDFEPDGLEPICEKVVAFPNLTFTGYQPDCFYIGKDGRDIQGPMGTYHSALVAGAFLDGLQPDRSVRLFNNYVLPRLESPSGRWTSPVSHSTATSSRTFPTTNSSAPCAGRCVRRSLRPSASPTVAMTSSMGAGESRTVSCSRFPATIGPRTGRPTHADHDPRVFGRIASCRVQARRRAR